VAAGVAFHWLRRERVRERDIFRLGNGTVVLLRVSFRQAQLRARKYPPVGSSLQNRGPIRVSSPQAPSIVGQQPHANGLREGRPISRHMWRIALRNL